MQEIGVYCEEGKHYVPPDGKKENRQRQESFVFGRNRKQMQSISIIFIFYVAFKSNYYQFDSIYHHHILQSAV